MDKKQLMAGTLAALTVASALPTTALAAQAEQEKTTIPYAVLAMQNEDEGSSAVVPFAEMTLQEQINAAKDGVQTRITLQGDLSEDVTIPAEKNILLALGGHKLTNVSGNTITNNGTLTIEGSGTVDNISHGKAAIYNNVGGTVVLNGGSYTRSKENGQSSTASGGNSYYNIVNWGDMTINDGVEVSQTGHFSSMIENGFYNGSGKTNDPKLTINGGSFFGGLNTVKNDDRGVLEIKGGTFENVSQAAVLNWNDATIDGGTFQANDGAQAVVLNGKINDTMNLGKLTINGGSFTASGAGTVIQEMTGSGAKSIGTVEINDGTFESKSGKIIGLTAGNEDQAQINIVKGSFSTSDESAKAALAQYVDPTSELDTATGTVSALPAERAAVSVGAKNYKTLAAAIEAAKSGDEIVLKQDVTESVTVPANKEITLDLAGKNIQSSANAVTVQGKLTVKDSTATAAPVVNGNDVTYTSGKITGANIALYAIEGGEIVLESGSVESTGNIGIYAQGNYTLGGTAQNSKITVKGGYVLAPEFAASAQGNGAELDIQDGVLKAKDNAVIGGNGTKNSTKDCGGTIMNISGGTMIGEIKSSGYIACGVYHPQQGELNITGGKFYITNGVGVLVRAGNANITGGEIITTGSVNGKVGDSQIIEGCFGVVYDTVSKYPGAADADKITVGGDAKIVTDNGNDPIKMRRPDGSTDNKIGVTGGTFSAPVDKEYLKGLNAELNTGKGDAPYSYYTDVDAAKEAAKQLGGGTITDLSAQTATSYNVTLKLDNGEADQTFTVQENGTLVLPTPTREGRWAFVHWTDGTTTYAAGDEYTVTKEVTLTAVWESTERTITLKYDDGATQDGTITAAVNDVITLPTPTRSGRYTFQHWTDGTNTYAGGSDYTVTGNVTLTAVWHYTGSGSSSSSSNPSYAVSVPSRVANGSVSVAPGSASKGTTVTITVKPDSGYELDSLTVTDQSGNRLSLSDKGNGKYTFVMPSGKVSVDASFAKIETAVSFRDVKQGDYFYDAVQWAVDKGITEGTSATTFSPNASCTRAQMVTFLWRAAGSPAPKSTTNPFRDVSSSDYYYNAVLWAVENGITTGTGADTFAPNATVTRGQTVTFLYRAAGSPAAGSNSGFSDVNANDYYNSAVAWAAQNGITGGTGNGKFSPKADCTRGQIVTLLYRANN